MGVQLSLSTSTLSGTDESHTTELEGVRSWLDRIKLHSYHVPRCVLQDLLSKESKGFQLPLPYTDKRKCALLFVDISGFTKLSTILDEEDLSNVINDYFQKMVDEVVRYGGDIIKFAGDAFFAEWRETSDENQSLSECVFAASMCASSIVTNCSNFNATPPCNLPISFDKDQQSDATLNVHCGVGVGTLVGVHVGDDTRTSEGVLNQNRREYLVLGSPIVQVSKAAEKAKPGQVFASPEAISYLSVSDDMPLSTEPVLIASHELKFVHPKSTKKPSVTTMHASVKAHCKNLDEIKLALLHQQLALYVHPVARGDDPAVNTVMHRAPAKPWSTDASQNRHRAEAERRDVYTMFVKAGISPSLTESDTDNNELYAKLQMIMQVTCRELDKYKGHLRQFIVDDKGVVLIATFGLRGSTFPGMVAKHALPATLALHTALKSELDVESRIGATLGKVYCGVVGGSRRHEFAVMGRGVNLAARLMGTDTNKGILVDKAVVKACADERFDFKSLNAIKAKGYDQVVKIFEPSHAVRTKRRNPHGHIGRKMPTEKLVDAAKGIMNETSPNQTIMAFVTGASGIGKTELCYCVSDKVEKYAKEHGKQVIVASSKSTETSQNIPFSSFKKIFLCAIKERCLHDGTSPAHEIPYLQKLRDICEEVKYPVEYADFVGSRFLGLEGAIPHTHIKWRVPTIEEVVNFLTTTYIRFTDFSDLIIIFLYDSQWIDSPTLKVIRALCRKDKNILLIGTMQSQETPALRSMSSDEAWHGEIQPRILEFSLGPLDFAEVKEAISKVLGYEESVIDNSLCEDILKRTFGLPIYVIKLLKSIKCKETVAIDKESGLLQWTPGAQSGQDRMGSNNVAMIEPLFLERFDELDATVRRVLQTCAVLGSSIFLSDVIRVHHELEETVTEQCLKKAVDKSILIENTEDEDKDDVSFWSNDESRANQSKAKHVALKDRFFQFSHDMWRKSVLDAMLKDQKINFHRLIAKEMESEQVNIKESNDIGRLLSLFDHWKYCGNFSKAAPLALAVGLRLEEWKLATQSLIVYRDALEMCYKSADHADDKGETPRSGKELWLHATAPMTTLEFILQLHIQIAKCHAHLGHEEQCATTFEEAYTSISTAIEAPSFNSERLFPMISDLCAIAIQGGTFDKESVAKQHKLVNMFVDEAERHKDTYHLPQALAMEAHFYARHGQFYCARLSAETLFSVYDIKLHSAAIQKDYGKDYAAQTIANSTEWFLIGGKNAMASKRADYVVELLLPHLGSGEIDAKMELIFPILMVLNALGRSPYAEETLFNKIINPYHDFKNSNPYHNVGSLNSYWLKFFNPFAYLMEVIKKKTGGVSNAEKDGGGSNSYWLKFFNPFAYLMEVINMETDGVSNAEKMIVISDIENWVIDDKNSIFAPELQRKGNWIVGEICWRLWKLKDANGGNADNLLKRGHRLLASADFIRDSNESDPFVIMQARETRGKLLLKEYPH